MFVTYSTIVAILAATAVAAPLNINLGAYSPAMVVGDGEISFGGEAQKPGQAAALVSTLQGSSVSQPAAQPAQAAAAPAGRAAILSEPASLPVPGVSRDLLSPRGEEEQDVDKRQEDGLAKRQAAASGFDRALVFAEAALVKGPKVQLGTGKNGAGVGIVVENTPQKTAAAPAKAAR